MKAIHETKRYDAEWELCTSQGWWQVPMTRMETDVICNRIYQMQILRVNLHHIDMKYLHARHDRTNSWSA